jgi:GntR family transcriptional regulator, transcriptional repressor for pyruvate dehydrogenase complex
VAGASHPAAPKAPRCNARSTSLRGLAEFRLSFEPENAWWAAQRAGDDDVAQLTALVDEANAVMAAGDSWKPIGEVDARWHEALARATKNNLRIGISQGIHDAVMHQVRALAPTAAEYGADIPRDLARITKAVGARNRDEAREAMRRHVARFVKLNEALREG